MSVEPESLSKPAPKKRGRPRRSEASRKTDDGDNTEDVGLTLLNEREGNLR